MTTRGGLFHAQVASCCIFAGAQATQTVSSTALVDAARSSGTEVAEYYQVDRSGGEICVGSSTKSLASRFYGVVRYGKGDRPVSPGSSALLDLDRKVAEWSSNGGCPVSETAIQNARVALKGMSILPERIALTPDESVLFEIYSETKHAIVEFFGTGEIAVVIRAPESEGLFDFCSPKDVTDFVSSALERA